MPRVTLALNGVKVLHGGAPSGHEPALDGSDCTIDLDLALMFPKGSRLEMLVGGSRRPACHPNPRPVAEPFRVARGRCL